MAERTPGFFGDPFNAIIPQQAEAVVKKRTSIEAIAEYKVGVLRADVSVVHRKWKAKVTGIVGQDGKPLTIEDRKKLMQESGLKPMFVQNEKGEYEASKEVFGHGEKFKVEAEAMGASAQRFMEEANPPLRIAPTPKEFVPLLPEEQPAPLTGEFSD